MAGNKYEDWVAQKFQGLTRDELKEAGGIFGVTFAGNTSEKTMRQKLCEKTGASFDEPVVEAPRTDGKKPNLTAKGIWQGRRQRVIISRSKEDTQHKGKALIWEATTRVFPYDVPVDMPDPYFHVLNNAVSAHVSQESVRDKEGNLLRYDRVESPYNVHQFRHIGVTPGTEDLPTDLQDYWRGVANKTNGFENYKRSTLIEIRSDFVGSVGMDKYRDLTNEDIRADILRHCGLDSTAFIELAA